MMHSQNRLRYIRPIFDTVQECGGQSRCKETDKENFLNDISSNANGKFSVRTVVARCSVAKFREKHLTVDKVGLEKVRKKRDRN